MKKAIEKITELLDKELDDYSIKYRYEIYEDEPDDYTILNVTIFDKIMKWERDISIKYEYSSDKVYINLSEDSWHEIEWFETTIKYFWMALLDWPRGR